MKVKSLLKLMAFVLLSNTTISAQTVDSLSEQKIDEVLISAFRVKSDLSIMPNKVEVLKLHDIQSVSSENLGDLLKKTSGFDIVEYTGLSATIGLRGYSPSAHSGAYTKVLVDGIPTGTKNISTLELDNVEQVEILKGPFSSFYGSGAMAGIVSIVSPKNKGQITGNAGFSYGSFNTYSVFANSGGKINYKLNFDFYARHFSRLDNYKTGNNNLLALNETEKQLMDEKSYGKTYENTKFNKNNAGLRLGLDLNDHIELNLYQVFFFADHVQTNGTFWGIYGDLEKDIQRWSQRLDIQWKTGNHQLKFIPYYSTENTSYYNEISDTNYVNSKYNFKTYGFVLQDAVKIGEHNIIFGVDNNSEKNVSQQWLDKNNLTSPYNPDYLNMTTGIFVQANLNFLQNRLNATLGGRYDNINFKLFKTDYIESVDASEKYNTFNPNFGLQYELIKGLKVHGSTGTAFVAPDAFKVAGNYNYSSTWGQFNYKGNPDLKPETSFSYDLGLSYQNSKYGISADISYFDNKHKDLIVTDYSNMDTTSFINADKANMNGIELVAAYDFGSLADCKYSLKIYLNFTHLLNAEVIVDEVSENMNYVRDYNASFGLDFRNFKGLSARLNGRYIGQRNEDNWLYTFDYTTWERISYQTADGEDIRPELINEDILRYPAFLIFDISVSYTLKDKYMFALKADNIFDDNYTEKDTYYMPGRAITGSFTYKF